jgi:hypothetical protein
VTVLPSSQTSPVSTRPSPHAIGKHVPPWQAPFVISEVMQVAPSVAPLHAVICSEVAHTFCAGALSITHVVSAGQVVPSLHATSLELTHPDNDAAVISTAAAAHPRSDIPPLSAATQRAAITQSVVVGSRTCDRS